MDFFGGVLGLFLPFLCLLHVIEAQDTTTTTFDFACSRLTGLCQTGTCAVETQQCQCPADGNTYNYDCTDSTAAGYCESTDLYGANCDIPRVYIACVPGKMFINVLTHGGTTKFTNGLMYVNERQGVASCQFTLATTQVYQDKALEYGFLYPDSMEGYYIELSNTDATCGDAVVSDEPASADTPASTLYTRTFKIQYNQYITNSLDQLLTASCREIQGATQVSTGIGQVITNDDSDLKQVNVENEVGIVGLEMLDSSYQPMESTIALGTEIVLRFTLGTGNDYTDLWLSGCKANNTLGVDDPDFKSIDIIDDKGCPAEGSVGIFKTFPQKEDAADGSKILLMSIGAFRFTGSSDQVGFLCDINLCDTTNAADCANPSCDGYTSPTLDVIDDTDTTTPDETEALSATIASSVQNPLELADTVTLTCTAAGGTAPYQYYIREVGNTAAITYGDTNTLDVPAASAAGIKNYECLVQDAVPATVTSVQVSLEYVDTFTAGISQSPEGDALINTNVEITCRAAGGTGPYTLSLLQDGAAISSTFPYVATSTTIVSNVYKCSATDTGNANAVVESPEITLNFINPPTVALASDQTNPVPENTDVILTYTATGGTDPYTAQWLVNDVEAVGETGTQYTVTYQAGATVKVTISITDAESQVVTEDYTVEFADAQVPAALSATIATTSLNPLSLTDAVTLTCTATGGTAPYRYYIREVGNTDIETYGDTNTLEIPIATAAGTKQYECLVQDAVPATAASAEPVSLVYVDALSAQAYADPAGPVEIGTAVTLTCKAAGSANALTFSWSKDGTADYQTTESFVETVTGAATHSYTCTVSDATAGATATTTPALEIEFTAPALAVQLAADQTNPVPENTDAIITYTVTGGTAPYTAQWFLDDLEAAGQTGPQYTATYQAGVTVKVSVQITDANSAVVTADYSVEFAGTTAPAALSAAITTPALNPLGLTEPVTLTCTATGGTAPYQYYIREVGNTDPVTYEDITFLTIPSAAAAGTKEYECLVQDAVPATATSTEPVSLVYVDTLTAATYADPPSPVTVNTPVTLTCKAAGAPNPVTYQWTKDTVALSTDESFQDTVTAAATHSYVCVVTDTVDATSTVSTTPLAIEFTAARKRRSVSLRRSKRDTADHDSVSTVISVYDPKAGTTDGQVEPVKETDCYDQSDVIIVVIILSVVVVLLLVLSAILGMMLMRSRKKVAHYDHKMGDYGYPTQTLAMPRLEISSGAGSSSGYSNRAI